MTDNVLHADVPFSVLLSLPFSVTAVTDKRRRAAVCLFPTELPAVSWRETGSPLLVTASMAHVFLERQRGLRKLHFAGGFVREAYE